MDKIKLIISFYKKLYCVPPLGEYVEDSGVSVVKSGRNHRDTNICFIEKIFDFNTQKSILNENFNVNGLVFSVPASRPMIRLMKDSMVYLGNVGIMESNKYSASHTNNNRILKMDKTKIDDYVNFISKEKNLDKEFLTKIIESSFDSLWIYMAYDGFNVVGAGTAIENDGTIFITDTIVKKEYRNKGILYEIGEVSMNDAMRSGAKGVLSIVSSSFSQSVAEKMGYKELMVLDLWENRSL